MHKVTCIIMAGGKSSRFDFTKVSDSSHKFCEKPLLKANGKFFIDYIIDAVAKSEYIENIIIATSPNTKNTHKYLESLKSYERLPKISVIETPGNGYLSDLNFLVEFAKLTTVITISADIPLINSEIIDESMVNYLRNGKSNMTVYARKSLYSKIGLKPTDIVKIKGLKQDLVPIGINILNVKSLKDSNLKSSYYITENFDAIFNINTFEDYNLLQNRFHKCN